jgi:hypothetical protein
MQPIRTTISFSEKATQIINAIEPLNLSDFVSKAVEGYYATEKQVMWQEYNTAFTKMRELLPILLPGKEAIIQDIK